MEQKKMRTNRRWMRWVLEATSGSSLEMPYRRGQRRRRAA
jgi:hypothetical protein